MEAFSDHIAMLIERGGYVMVPLLALSVISLSLIVERISFWSMTHGPSRLRQLSRLNDALRRGKIETAKVLVEHDRTPYGRVASDLITNGFTEAVAIEAVESQRPRLDRFMVTLSTIVTAAPLLGILGTVVGIIQSFRLLGGQTTLTDPREVAGGIASALLTTALGLIVALMTLFPYMVFKSQAGRSLGRMESVIAAAQQGAAIAGFARPERALTGPPGSNTPERSPESFAPGGHPGDQAPGGGKAEASAASAEASPPTPAVPIRR